MALSSLQSGFAALLCRKKLFDFFYYLRIGFAALIDYETSISQ